MQVKILTHNSGEYQTTVEMLDMAVLNEELNNTGVNTVLIGELIFSRIDVKAVIPLQE